MRAYLFELFKENNEQKEVIAHIDYASIDHTHVYNQEFFGNFDDMMDYVEAGVAQTAAERQADIRVFDTTVAALVLAFCGLLIQDACHVKKSDLHPTLPKLRDATGKYIAIPDRAYRCLTDYCHADGMYTRKDMTAWQPYVGSAYLLRTNRSMQLNPVAIRAGITRYIPLEGKHVTYDSTYWSGVFYRVYCYERKHGVIVQPSRNNKPDRDAFVAKLKALMGARVSVEADLYARFRQYSAYKRFFYPDE